MRRTVELSCRTSVGVALAVLMVAGCATGFTDEGDLETSPVPDQQESDGEVKTAIVALLANISPEVARQRLRETGGFVRKAIG